MDLEDVATVIECAELAPSVHNTQPWKLAVSGDTIAIRADRDRALSTLDPTGRELTISCGAAVEFAAIAVRGLGWEPATSLMPDPADADLLATITIGARRAADSNDRELLDAIPRRYTDRGHYEPRELTTELADTLRRGVSERGAWLRVLDRDGDRLAVVQALAKAEAAEAADPAYRKEIEDWLRSEHAPDGLPPDALAGLAWSGRVSDVQLRDFTGMNNHPEPGADEPPEVDRDALLMIGTESDAATDWMRAGTALGWLLLTLTVAGWSSQPLGQALDIESTRLSLSRQIGLIGHVQFVLRTGEGHGRPTTGRRHAAVR
jgi:nitroreductase